jgi:predicted Fe-S protein YdhL (DUF1289 family)
MSSGSSTSPDLQNSRETLRCDDEQAESTDLADTPTVDLIKPVAGEQQQQQQETRDDSDSCKLDHLGPMIIGTDGSIQRVANWNTMLKVEQEQAIRLIAKRNQKRLAVLRAQPENDENVKLDIDSDKAASCVVGLLR